MHLEELISRVSEFTDDGVLITEAEPNAASGHRILWCNVAVVQQTGYARDELIGRSPRMLQGPETDGPTLNRIGTQIRAWKPVREHVLNYRKDDSTFWTDLSLRPVADESGQYHYWIGIQRDVTALINLQEKLVQARQDAETAQTRLMSAIDVLPDAFVIYDDEDRLVLCNNQYRETYAASASAIKQGAKFEDVIKAGLRNGQYPEALGQEREWFEKRLNRHRNPQGAMEQALPGNRFLQINEVRTQFGDTVGFRTDVTTLRRQKQALEEQATALEHAAFYDELTGLPNRKLLQLDLQRRLKRPHDASALVCVLHIDLDRFKEVNDTLGHSIGDAVLREAGQIMRANIRATDFVARVGGDEFVVVMDFTGHKHASQANNIAETLIGKLRSPMLVQEHTCTIGASIGLAFAENSHWEADRIIGNADIALYEAKRNGKGKAVCFEPSMRGNMERRHALIQEIEAAVETRQFVPYFQPKIAIADGKLAGFEVLTRWDHPMRGILAPSEFLALADETGLLEAIEQEAIRGALDGLIRFRSEGWDVPHIAVNASAGSLRDPYYAADLKKAIAMRGLSVRDIRVEVVEDIVIGDDSDLALTTLGELSRDGFHVDLDDFGTGYASLATLAKLELAGLKIDMELVRTLDELRSRKITEAIVSLAKSLGIQVTAEGVETEMQYAILREMGCNFAQGYSISRPLALDAVSDWLESYHKASNTMGIPAEH